MEDEKPEETLVRAAQARRRPAVGALLFATLFVTGVGAAVGAAVAIGLHGSPSQGPLPVAPLLAAVATPPPIVITPPPSRPTPAGRGIRGAWVTDAEGLRLILGPANKDWAQDGGTVKFEDVAVTVVSPIDEAFLSDVYRDARGRMYELYNSEGVVCRAQAGHATEIFGRYYYEYDYEKPPKVGAAWEMVSTPVLTLALVPVRGDCKGAVWARDATYDPPPIGVLSEVAPDVRKQAVAAFRRLKQYNNVQTDYEKFTADVGVEAIEAEGLTPKGPWDGSDGEYLTVETVAGPSEQLVLVNANLGGCGDFTASLTAIYRRDGDQLTLAWVSGEAFGSIEAAADIDGDGHLELWLTEYSSGQVLLHYQDGYQRRQILQTPSFICPC